ncbi:MAG: antibiotic biosynthesis monooxygenase [Smithellaceae bacterium]
MILVITRMKVFSEKRLELSQTLDSLSASIRQAQGCSHCECFRSIEDEDQLLLFEEWDNDENLTTHLNSEDYRVIRGVRNLLREPYERKHYVVKLMKEGQLS